MIRINLLSPLDKENLRWEKINKLAARTITWILLAEAIFVGVFLVTVEYLKTEEGAVAAEFSQVNSLPATREMAGIEKEAQRSRTQVASIYALKEERTDWTALFENISLLTPAGVRLQSVLVEKETPAGQTATQAVQGAGPEGEAAAQVQAPAPAAKLKVTAVGNAKTREELLRFEANLKEKKIFSGLEHDAANYVKSVDIDFKYAFYVSEEELLK
jgi:Tfp pilus assembly protein PilN